MEIQGGHTVRQDPLVCPRIILAFSLKSLHLRLRRGPAEAGTDEDVSA